METRKPPAPILNIPKTARTKNSSHSHTRNESISGTNPFPSKTNLQKYNAVKIKTAADKNEVIWDRLLNYCKH